MKKDTKNIVAAVRQLITPIVQGLGYDLWDVEYVKEGSVYYLRITIDKFEGIDITDCEKVHRAIDAPLDELDPIADAYMLQVSSPGIERELKYPEHFTAFIGEEICAKAFAPLPQAQGRKQVTGILRAYDGATVRIAEAEHEIEIPMEKIATVKTVYDFSKNAEEGKS